jgi:phytoene dehydrogenase-like protein
MGRSRWREAFVIGSGPNGLTAAINLARAGLKVTVLEAQGTIGGGARSAQLTLPGFIHDVCSAVHPLAVCSPAFAQMPLHQYGLEWIYPPIPLAHPLDPELNSGRVATLRDLRDSSALLRHLMDYFGAHWSELSEEVLAPLHVPRHPMLLATFGLLALFPTTWLRALFAHEKERTLFAGIAAHSMVPLDMSGSAAIGWVLALAAYTSGWPIPRGGSQRISDALASYLTSLGGNIITSTEVTSLRGFPADAAVLCDLTPRQLLRIAGGQLPRPWQRRLQHYAYGCGVFKVDWALRAPIPWLHPECSQAGTVHLSGTSKEIADSERAAWEGRRPRNPFVLLTQPSLFDSSRAPEGMHTAWAYCHIANGSMEDMTRVIEAQVEKFAPGFGDTIIARYISSPAELEKRNANLIGGDIGGGAATLVQLLARPTWKLYRTPQPNLFLCSSSTPPGAGVHGLCGYYAAKAVLESGKL